MSLQNTTVALLGLGAMGLPMATNLARQGATVHGYDIAPERLALAAEAGITGASSAREAAREADVVLLAVRNAEQLQDALYGPDGVIEVLHEGGVVLLTSTVGIEEVRAVAATLAETGHLLVDAPVSGGPVRAGEGDLLVTVGAQNAAWEAASPVLEAMAGTLVRVGARAGDGQAMKTVNQLLCGVHIAAARDAHLATPVAAAAQNLYLLGEAQGKAAQDDSTVVTVVSPTKRS